MSKEATNCGLVDGLGDGLGLNCLEIYGKKSLGEIMDKGGVNKKLKGVNSVYYEETTIEKIINYIKDLFEKIIK